MKNRKMKRSTWIGQNPGITSSDIIVSTGSGSPGFAPNRYGEKLVAGPSYPIAGPPPGALVPPPFAYNSNQRSSVASGPVMNPYSGMATPTTSVSGTLGNSATVKSTFIPTLPDELSINIGEVVGVMAEYDDGWVLCANALGEKGMVPLECLERGVASAYSGSSASLGRPSRRSSLAQRV